MNTTHEVSRRGLLRALLGTSAAGLSVALVKDASAPTGTIWDGGTP